jgi:hypothetical protein
VPNIGICVSVRLDDTRSKSTAVLKNYVMKTPTLIDLLYSDFLSSPMLEITLISTTLSTKLTALITTEIAN